MKLSRFIAAIILVSGLMATGHAQVSPIATIKSKVVVQQGIASEPGVESPATHRRSGITDLFASFGNQFEPTTGAGDSPAATPKPQAVHEDKWQFQLTPATTSTSAA